MADEHSLSQRAEAIYGEFLAARQAGRESHLEELIARNPELADQLRALDVEWSELEALRARLDAPSDGHQSPLNGFTRSPWEKPPAAPEDVLEHIERRRRPIERYRFRGEVGRGGMGVVLRVHDDDLRRDLAMKVMFADSSGSTRVLDAQDTRRLGRFLEEAQVTGQLDHPGIVPVHEVGLDAEGRIFFTMKLVHGQDLARIFELVEGEHEGWTRTRALGVMLKVCEAMAYSHAKGVVHRDLKPSNVMVGNFGAVYVMDWGLARVVGSDRSGTPVDVTGLRTVRSHSDSDPMLETLDGDVIGTPAYMSPEQALGQAAEAGPTTDVYAVGAMLYQLLAGRMPYVDRGDGRRTVVRRVREEPPTPLHALTDDVPAELTAIVEKAMARVPEERYATMEELGEDLRAYLEGRVVRAYETGAVAELRKWIGRNRALAAGLAAGLLVAILGLGTAALVQSKARAQERASKERLAEINEELEGANIDLAAARNRALENEELATTRADEATRERLAADRVVDFLVGLFESPTPAQARGAEVSARELLERGVESIDEDEELDPFVRARLLETMGSAYYSLGRFRESRALFEQSIAVRTRHDGPEDPRTLRARRLLGETKTILREGDAAAYLQARVEESTRILGPNDPETITTRASFSWALELDNAYAEVAAMIDPLLADCRRVLGEDHSITLGVRFRQATNLKDLGHYEAAELAFQDVWDRTMRLNGEDHPGTLKTVSALASFYYELDRIPESLELFERAALLSARIYEESHVHQATYLSNLAQAYLRAGRIEESEAIQLEVLERSRELVGDDHEETLTTYANLSSLYLFAGRLDECEEYALIAYEGAVSGLGENHPLAIASTCNLAHVAAARGRGEEAEELWRQAVRMRRDLNGPEHPLTLDVLWMLAFFYNERGRFEEALPLARTLVEETPENLPRYGERVELLERLVEQLGPPR